MHFCIFTGAGDMDVLQLMVEKGATHFHDGLKNACANGRVDMIEYLIKCGADCWEDGYFNACEGRYENVKKMMLERMTPAQRKRCESNQD